MASVRIGERARHVLRTACAAGAALSAPLIARGVIVATNPLSAPQPSATTQPPPGVTGWNNLGRLGIGGGVYIGNGWFLTATHLDPGFNHTIFIANPQFPDDVSKQYVVGLDASSVTRLSNGAGNADMDLVHVASDSQSTLASIGLQQLNLSVATPSLGTAITLAGIGSVRGSPVTYSATPIGGGHFQWTVNPNGTFSGYSFDPGDNAATEKRWGTNVTRTVNNNQATEVVANTNNGSNTVVFGADFTDPTSGQASTYEAIGVNHDSGGAVFGPDGTLLGILLYEATFQDQPSGTALFGNFTYASDLSQYYAQIKSVTGVPEPTTALVAAGGAALLLRRGRRRQA